MMCRCALNSWSTRWRVGGTFVDELRLEVSEAAGAAATATSATASTAAAAVAAATAAAGAAGAAKGVERPDRDTTKVSQQPQRAGTAAYQRHRLLACRSVARGTGSLEDLTGTPLSPLSLPVFLSCASLFVSLSLFLSVSSSLSCNCGAGSCGRVGCEVGTPPVTHTQCVSTCADPPFSDLPSVRLKWSSVGGMRVWRWTLHSRSRSADSLPSTTPPPPSPIPFAAHPVHRHQHGRVLDANASSGVHLPATGRSWPEPGPSEPRWRQFLLRVESRTGAGRWPRRPADLRRHPAQPLAVSRHPLLQDAASQSTRSRLHVRSLATGRQLGALAQRPVPRWHAALPLLALQVSGAAVHGNQNLRLTRLPFVSFSMTSGVVRCVLTGRSIHAAASANGSASGARVAWRRTATPGPTCYAATSFPWTTTCASGLWTVTRALTVIPCYPFWGGTRFFSSPTQTRLVGRRRGRQVSGIVPIPHNANDGFIFWLLIPPPRCRLRPVPYLSLAGGPTLFDVLEGFFFRGRVCKECGRSATLMYASEAAGGRRADRGGARAQVSAVSFIFCAGLVQSR